MKYFTPIVSSLTFLCVTIVLYLYMPKHESEPEIKSNTGETVRGTPLHHLADSPETRLSERPLQITDGHPENPLKHFQASEFYRTIVANNLFRPLGYRPPTSGGGVYRLLGTLVSGASEGVWVAKAVFSVGGEIRVLGINDALDSQTSVLGIDRHSVLLEQNGKEIVVVMSVSDVLLRGRGR